MRIYICTCVATAHRDAHIYICSRVATAHLDAHIYICMQYKQAPTAPSYTAKQDCGVNPCLLSSNNSRSHLSTYYSEETGRGGTSTGVIVNFDKGCQM